MLFRSPTIISSYQKEAWYTTAKEKDNNQSVYLQFAPIAEGLLYIDLEEQVIIVDYINFGKKTLYFITLDGQKGFFKYDRFLSNVSVGDVLKTQIIKKDDKGMCHIATLVKSEDAAFNKDFIKDFKGEIKVLKDQNFGFVENVFIIPSLFNKYKLSNKDTVCGKAIKSFNEKKKEWGWKALCISK